MWHTLRHLMDKPKLDIFCKKFGRRTETKGKNEPIIPGNAWDHRDFTRSAQYEGEDENNADRAFRHGGWKGDIGWE